jgi:TonB family protein
VTARKEHICLLLSACAFLTTASEARAEHAIWSSYFTAGRAALTSESLDQAEKLFEASLKESTSSGDITSERASSLFALGVLALKQKHYTISEHNLKQALEIESKLFNANAVTIGLTHELLGDVALAGKYLTEAESEYRRALEGTESLGRDNPQDKHILNMLAIIYSQQGKALEASALKHEDEPHFDAADMLAAYLDSAKKAAPISMRMDWPKPVGPVTNAGGERPAGSLLAHQGSSGLSQVGGNNGGSFGHPPDREVDFGPFMSMVHRKIKLGWEPPPGAENDRVVVIFKVLKDGTVSDLRIEHGTEKAGANEAALKAVRTAGPFDTTGLRIPAKGVDIQFTFDGNVFAGGHRHER